MNVLNAYGRLCVREDRSIVPQQMGVRINDGPLMDAWPETATAIASLSGQLEDAKNDADLEAAINHGLSLWACGVIQTQEVEKEAESVVRQLIDWGVRVETCLN